jgi:hypothetical protein
MIEFQLLRTALNGRSRIPVYSLCAGIPQESRLSLYEFEILACLEFIFVPETHTDRLIGTAEEVRTDNRKARPLCQTGRAIVTAVRATAEAKYSRNTERKLL